jgi:hypothetical protein
MVGSAMAAADGGGGVEGRLDGAEEERLDRDTRLSRVSGPKTAEPRLRSSQPAAGDAAELWLSRAMVEEED